MVKTMQKITKDKVKLALVEVLMGVIILGIFVLPRYANSQELSKEDILIKAATAAEPQLRAWLKSSLKTGDDAKLVEQDTNGDGVINELDLSNSALRLAGVCNKYVNMEGLRGNKSPFSASLSLWHTHEGAGRIGCIMTKEKEIIIIVQDNDRHIIYQTIIEPD